MSEDDRLFTKCSGVLRVKGTFTLIPASGINMFFHLNLQKYDIPINLELFFPCGELNYTFLLTLKTLQANIFAHFDLLDFWVEGWACTIPYNSFNMRPSHKSKLVPKTAVIRLCYEGKRVGMTLFCHLLRGT